MRICVDYKNDRRCLKTDLYLGTFEWLARNIRHGLGNNGNNVKKLHKSHSYTTPFSHNSPTIFQQQNELQVNADLFLFVRLFVRRSYQRSLFFEALTMLISCDMIFMHLFDEYLCVWVWVCVCPCVVSQMRMKIRIIKITILKTCFEWSRKKTHTKHRSEDERCAPR